MALLSSEGTVPKSAIALSRDEALIYQWKQINTWKNKSDVWIYRWGISSLGAIAGMSGMYINARYRKQLKVRDYGSLTTSIPLIGAPALFSIFAHVQFVTSDLFLNETKCSVCLQQRAIGLQIVSAILYPTLMSPIVNFYIALSYATYRVPYWKDVKGTLNLWWKLTKPMGPSFLVIACIQAAAATCVTYMEADSLYKLKIKLIQIPEETEIQTTENVTVEE